MARIWILFSFIVLLFAAVGVRLFYWQIVEGESLRAEASAQYNLELAIPASRGSIEASDGSPLAMNQEGFLVYAQPKEIKDSNIFVRFVAPILTLEATKLYELLTLPGR